MATLFFEVRVARPQTIVEGVLQKMNAVGGVGPMVARFLLEKYGIGSVSADIFGFATDYWNTQISRKISSKRLIGTKSDQNKVNTEELDRCILSLILAGDFATNAEKQQLFVRLQKFRTDEDGIKSQLERIQGGDVLPAIFDLGITSGRSITTCELRRLAIKTVIIKVIRQESGVGSCFAVAPLVYIQLTQPTKLMELLEKIVLQGNIPATHGGSLVLVPLNPYGGTDGKRKAHRATALHRAIARTAADASAQIAPGEKAFLTYANDLKNRIEKIEKLLPEAGITKYVLTYDPPRFDTRVFCTTEKREDAAEKTERGAWVPHIRLGSGINLQSLDYLSALHILHEAAISHKKELEKLPKKTTPNHIQIEAKIDKTKELLKELEDAQAAFVPKHGGLDTSVMEALLGVKFSYDTAHTFTSTEDAFWHYFQVLVDSPGETKRILAHAVGHSFTIAPELSPSLMKAIADAKAAPSQRREIFDSIVKRIKAGERVTFIDPQWEGVRGISIGTDKNSRGLQFFLECTTKNATPHENEEMDFLCKDVVIPRTLP
ncbi:MAG: hypothetical protein LBH53_01725 [Puniceicoccales bacterium]|nr:hypothetical protein [Puniceicoccales bacterium]